MNQVNKLDLFPFSEVKSEEYKTIIFDKIQKAQQDLDTICAQSDEPSFSNTILRIENNGHIYNRYVETFFNLNSACTDEIIQKDAHEIAERLSDFSNSILLNPLLFQRVKHVFDKEYHSIEDEESKRLLKNTYDAFVRNGALLSEEDKEKIRKIDSELSKLTLQFSDNVLKETNNEYLHVTDVNELRGLNEEYISMYRQLAASKHLDGYIINLQYPSFVPFMKYCSNRSLRERLYEKYMSRGNRKNEYDNNDVIKRIIHLRDERAKILGYSSHAEFVLQKRMAMNPETVKKFLDDLYEKAIPYAQKDIKSLQTVADKWNINDIAAYDHAFLAEELKKEHYEFSDEDLKPYFSLENCLQAAFSLAKDLYDLEFVKLENVDLYHEDVSVYEIVENQQHKAILYTDFFPRSNKKPGAWMTVFKNQRMEGMINIRPHISIVCNFNPPSDTQPSLLSFDELTTLFHEFGHALHGILADTKYESMSGTNVYWDFVELPSQFMENFCYNKEFLQSWAKHYKTGETIPNELIEKVIRSSQFMEAYQTIRQLSFGLLDMEYYTTNPEEIHSIMDFERKSISKTQLYPWYKDAIVSTSFSHIFGGGYDAGYYSYKWAEVLDADAYEYLERNKFDKEIIQKFKKLLSSGGTREPMELYKEFRGQEPDVTALLRRVGI